VDSVIFVVQTKAKKVIFQSHRDLLVDTCRWQEKVMILHKEFTERESEFTASTGRADSWKKKNFTEEAQCL